MYEVSEAVNPVGLLSLPLPISGSDASDETKRSNPMKPHGCSRCSKSFTSVHQLAQHTRLHTGERPYKCSEPTCGRSFIQLSNLQQHMSQHVKDPIKTEKNTNFNCVTCGKFFA